MRTLTTFSPNNMFFQRRTMKLAILVFGTSFVHSISACLGQQIASSNITSRLAARQSDSDRSHELLGDLFTIGARSQTAAAIQGILLGQTNAQSNEVYFSPITPRDSPQCAADVCCIWKYIAQDMEATFRDPSGQCNSLARAAVRLGFHDAGTWSRFTGFGGADGSIILAGEGGRAENVGLEEIITVVSLWYTEYSRHGIGMADLIQMGAKVATVVCPLGPRIRAFIGRLDSDFPNVEGLLPDIADDVESLIRLFEDKTIKPHGLGALVGAHTTSRQRFADPSRFLAPQDSTPGVWDLAFYQETIGSVEVPDGVVMFASDIRLSQHPRIRDEWRAFAEDEQDHWNEDYAREYVRLSLLGVNNINNLIECSKVLPDAIT